jgi:SAM-dependent methyltransferase
VTTTRSDYALRISDDELARYRLMAATAAVEEAADWAAAGITSGARVADVGCGPGALLALLADAVGPTGVAVGVDGDPEAVRWAREAIADLPQASVRVGSATNTGLEPGSFDTVMCRHVLAHNAGGEAAIVEHLADLVRPGGRVYLVDVDLTGARMMPIDPGLDINDAYLAFHARRGSDLMVGLRLGSLLEDAGLAVEQFRCATRLLRVPAGMRGPHWAARHAMVAEGAANEDDLDRWAAAFERMDRLPKRPWWFVPMFVAIGRRER